MSSGAAVGLIIGLVALAVIIYLCARARRKLQAFDRGAEQLFGEIYERIETLKEGAGERQGSPLRRD